MQLFGAEVVDFARNFAEDAPRVEHQHLVLVLFGLGLIEEPQLAGNGAGVKEVRPDGHHDVHVAGLDQALADLGLVAACARCLRGHDEPGSTLRIQVAIEVLNPEIIAVLDAALALFIAILFALGHSDAGQAEGQARIGGDLAGIHLIHIEGWIGHDVIALVEQVERVVVIGDVLLYVATETVDGQVHFRQVDGSLVLFVSPECEPLGRVLVVLFNDAGALDEHSARSAGRVEDGALGGFEHVGDELDQRNGGEELAAVVGLEVGELGEEVLVDAPEDIARSGFEFLGVEGADQVAEQVGRDGLVLLLGENALETRVVLLNRFHGVDDDLGQFGIGGLGDEVVELGLGAEKDGAALAEVLLGKGARDAVAGGQGLFDLRLDRQEPAVGVAQEDQAHDGHEVFIAGQLGVRAEQVGRPPEPGLDCFDIFQLRHAFCGSRYRVDRARSGPVNAGEAAGGWSQQPIANAGRELCALGKSIDRDTRGV